MRGFKSHILLFIIAGWSSLVARRAHNPKVVGSNPAPAIWSIGAVVYLASLSRRRSRVQIPHGPFDGSVAQLVEQWIEAPCVGGSIPSRAIENGGIAKWLNAAVCKTALSEFSGSNPLSSIIRDIV